MNFEEALKKVKAGTATADERAFVEQRMAEAQCALAGDEPLDFDEALAHVQAGTATDEEREYVKQQLADAAAVLRSDADEDEESEAAPAVEDEYVPEESIEANEGDGAHVDFEDALEHVQAGTATEQEKLYVTSQMAAANAFFSNDFRRSGAPVREASGAEVKKAKKSFKMRYIIIPVCVVLVAILAVGAILGGVFGFAATSAKNNMTISREECIQTAKMYVFNNQDRLFVGLAENTFGLEQLYIEDVERQFNYNGRNLGASYYSYEIEVKGRAALASERHPILEIEVKVRVNTATRNVEVIDLDSDRD